MGGQLFNPGEFSTVRQIDRQFRLYYNHTLYPELRRLEMRRRRLLLVLTGCVILALSLVSAAVYVGLTALVLISAVPVVLLFVLMLHQMQQFRQTFKPGIVGLLLEFIEQLPNIGQLDFSAEQFVSVEQFVESGIFSTAPPPFYTGEDLITGTIGELTFELSEVNARTPSAVQGGLETLFRGVFLHAVTAFPTEGQILMIPASKRKYLTRTIRQFTRDGAERVTAGLDPAFGQDFLVYATHDSAPSIPNQTPKPLRYFFPVSLQKYLRHYASQTGHPVFASFKGHDIYLAISMSKDILEPGIFTSNLHFGRIQEFVRDIMMLITLVNRLDQSH